MKNFWRTLWIFLAGILVVACLDSPDSPQINSEPVSISVCAFQKDSSCADPLKISPRDSFTLYAKISPGAAAGELSLRWVLGGGKVLAEGLEFKTDSSHAPDSLLVFDAEKNRLGTKIEYLFDNPPQFDSILSPADGDTLAGDSTTAFRFAYAASDADEGDSLFFTAVWDSVEFYAGTLTEVYQSGFSEGAHTFQVFVQDSRGQSDSSQTIRFYVREALP